MRKVIAVLCGCLLIFGLTARAATVASASVMPRRVPQQLVRPVPGAARTLTVGGEPVQLPPGSTERAGIIAFCAAVCEAIQIAAAVAQLAQMYWDAYGDDEPAQYDYGPYESWLSYYHPTADEVPAADSRFD